MVSASLQVRPFARALLGLAAFTLMGVSSRASAQTIVKPWFELIIDTSGSMGGSTGGGTNTCGYARTRINDAKCATQRIVAGTGDAVFGLEQFQQPCSTTCSGGVGTCNATYNSATLRVPIIDENQPTIISWVDNVCSGDCTPATDILEMWASGNTPLEGSLRRARRYFDNSEVAPFTSPIVPDDYAGCRPVSVILLTDGAETCTGTPANGATALRTTPVTLDRGRGTISVDIRTYVIGFGIAAGNAQIEGIALAGGTDAPGAYRGFYATDEATLSLALSQIIADSALVEVCDGADNNCNGLIDEGFPKFCNLPSHPAADLCTDPGETLCNGIDDNCDGRIDEGLTNACGTCGAVPVEVCDGLDNNCNGVIDEGGVCSCVPSPEICDNLDNNCNGFIDEGVTRPCGSSVGVCTTGTQICTAGVFGACSGTGPSPEICDNLDNDCDGATDGITRPCGSSVGACRPGTELCTMGAYGSCVGSIGPSSEICDGIDNNCNGSTDEGNPGGGGACGSSIGACRPGTFVCTAGALVCTGGVLPVAETCNSIDDNCNGVVDDGVPTAGPCGSAVGECRPGVLSCVAGAFACTGARGPVAEVCDGRDNDCDGATDEANPGGGAACGSSIGACRPGALTCTAGALACTGGVTPVAETCNGVDDDCNGLIDDGVPTAGACGSSTGECRPGLLACTAGAFVCTGARGPVAEICDARDNDCDGSTDEGNPGGGGACGSSVGECTQGALTCSAGVLVCAGGVTPVAETCNGLDDDCDGVVDDGVPTAGPCGSSTGECRPGVLACFAGGFVCMGARGPGAEICDGRDNDCDGMTDEGNPGGGAVCGSSVGICSPGLSVCTGGALVCMGGTGPGVEICNGLDDDCDSLVDEGNPGGGGSCGTTDVGVCDFGAFVCSAGALVCVGATGPTPERCNGLDDNCNGVVDEGDPEGGIACGDDTGECTPGVTLCRAGALVCDGGTGPTPEVCNGLDDDCDGVADEGLPVGAACGSSIGECAPGVNICRGGALVCEGEIGPTPEVCNALDDDCDGMVDEDLADGAECGSIVGACMPGVLRCDRATGREVCDGELGPAHEVCDCADNDCDGAIDEPPTMGTLCPAGSSCVDCQCAVPCVTTEFGDTCPTGRFAHRVGTDCFCVMELCDAMMCATESHGTGDTRCGPGATDPGACVCKENACTFPCNGTTCTDGRVCAPTTGRCVEDSCRGLGCPSGQLCDFTSGACRADPCATVTCATGEVCREGACERSCATVMCSATERCERGSCVPDPCADVSCRSGEYCNPVDGTCAPTMCTGVRCPMATICDPATGSCVPDPCNEVHCPEGQVCESGECTSAERPDAGPAGIDAGPDARRIDRVLATGGGGCACDVGAGVTSSGSSPLGALALALGLLGVVLARRRRLRIGGAARNAAIAVGIAFAASATAGCKVDPYCLNCGDPDTGVRHDAGLGDGSLADAGDGGAADADLDAGDAAMLPDGCVAGAPELCNGVDDNCNGMIDEGIDTSTDPINCGLCGHLCSDTIHGAFTTCVAGVCGYSTCDVGHYDIDGNPDNGCEYPCLPTETDDSICDRRDNDCDGTEDEDVLFATDSLNCGECGTVCRFAHADASCVASACVLGDCRAGYRNVDGNPDNGCEYACTPDPGGVEICNGRDDDCDGTIDDGDPGGGGTCGSSTGACSPGVEHCTAGIVVCAGDVAPTTELCNGIDDDCNGVVDNGNPEGGSPCGSGVGTCIQGRETCTAGALTCVGATGPATELCDGLDNDCNGVIDNGDPGGGGTCGSNTGTCTFGAQHCRGGVLLCEGGTGPTSEVCDSLDNNCNGTVDEGNPGGGSLCGSDVGLCRSGTNTCTAGALVCSGGSGPSPELCDGLDNDCDGVIDNGNPGGGGTCGSNTGACTFGTLNCRGGVLACEGGTTATAERCNGIDDDCNGVIDNGNPDGGSLCGSSVGLCTSGTNVCTAGALVCTGAGGPVAEVCDGLDNDCNGVVDNGNPGGGASCGIDTGACSFGTVNCVAGVLSCMGGTGPTAETCNGVDDDCNGVIDNGNPGGGSLCGSDVGLCRSGTNVCTGGALVCTGATGPVAELCDGLDNDCNGVIDNGNPGGGGTCGSNVGECRYGTRTCLGGTLVCSGGTGPTVEICDSRDNDCNSSTDETFNLTNDINNCGMCGNRCSFPHASAGCSASACRIVACDAGWVNLNGTLSDGCEYACSFTGAEICNGRDDNCDGLVDNGLTAPATFCNANGVCAGTLPTCGGATGWQCNYPPATYQATETRCDYLDNDCDGAVDEPFPTVGGSCANGIGACRRTGTIVCTAAGTGVVCNAPAPGATANEICDGLDNDCDGFTDEPRSTPGPDPRYVVEPMIRVSGSLYVYQYEAARPNATTVSQGTIGTRACSRADVLPWTNVTYPQALAACTAAGMRLCDESEWQTACRGTGGTCNWGSVSCTTYSAVTPQCNTNEYDPIAGAPDDDILLSTGSLAMCYASWGAPLTSHIFDMTGNVKEWTRDPATSPAANPIRGGSYNNISAGSRCDFNFNRADNVFQFANVGFRCCSSTAP